MRRIWSAVGHVRKLPGCTTLRADVAGAYIPVVAFAQDYESLELAVSRTFEAELWSIIELDDVMELAEPSRASLTGNTAYIVSRLSDDYPVQFHDTHNYSYLDA